MPRYLHGASPSKAFFVIPVLPHLTSFFPTGLLLRFKIYICSAEIMAKCEGQNLDLLIQGYIHSLGRKRHDLQLPYAINYTIHLIP